MLNVLFDPQLTTSIPNIFGKRWHDYRHFSVEKGGTMT